MRISELEPGDEIICYMRLGLAVKVAIRGNGTAYRYVPSKPVKAGPSDLTRFNAYVISNNSSEKVITMNIMRSDTWRVGFGKEPTLVADVSYSAFQRVRIFSKINLAPIQTNPTFPANFDDAAYKPFRTLTEVVLT